MADQDFPAPTHTPPNYSDDGDITSPSSDPHDSTYSEPPRVDNPWITPKQRKGLLEDFSEAAKKRVQKATAELAMLRCVVLNTPELYSVNYAHILARVTDPRMIEKLEYSWGMNFETLHVDSRHNVLRLNIAQHSEFDRARWLLLPEKRIIDIYLDHKKRPDRNFGALVNERAYQYRYIPAQSLRAAEIRRYSKTMNPTDHAGPNDFQSYYYPYLDLPPITSHVHPRFVICNIGLKMEDSDNVLQFFGSNSALPTDDKALIEGAITIFRKWTADIPAETNFYKQRHFGGPDGDDNSDITRLVRLNDQGVRRSTRAHPNGLLDTPSEKRSRKRPRGQQESDPVSLDGETLRALDEEVSPGKKLRLKRDSVAAWISSISEVKFDALTAPAEYILC